MSPLLLAALILKVAVAIEFDDLSPDDQAKLEAAVLAKYNVTLNDQTKQSSNINGSSQEASLDEASPDRSKREGFGLNVSKDSSQEASSDETLLEESKRKDSGSNVSKPEDSSQAASSDGALLEESKREDSGLSASKPEDSSQEAHSEEALPETSKSEDSGLNLHKFEDSSQEASSDEALPDESKREDSGLNVRKLEDSSAEASSDRQAGVQPEASQEASSSEPATSSKLMFKKPSNETAADGVTAPMNSSSEAPAAEVASSSNDTAAPASKPNKTKKSINDIAKGAQLTDNVAQKKKKTKTNKKTIVNNTERAAKLAEKRAEVEEIFHLSKKGQQTSHDSQVLPPAKTVFSLLRCSLFLAALSIAGYACHNYQAILEIYSRKGDSLLKRSYKAKREDDDTFTESSHFGRSTSSSLISSVMAGGLQNLSSRSGRNAMSLTSSEFGV